MPMICKVCRHPEKDKIDRLLVMGTSARAIAAEFDGLSDDGILRHKRKHLPEKLLKARDTHEIDEADALETELLAVARTLQRVVDEGMRQGSTEKGVCLACGTPWERTVPTRQTAVWRRIVVGASRALIELTAGRAALKGRAQLNVNVVTQLHPDLRTAIVSALAPFPDACHALVTCLAAFENSGSATMSSSLPKVPHIPDAPPHVPDIPPSSDGPISPPSGLGRH